MRLQSSSNDDITPHEVTFEVGTPGRGKGTAVGTGRGVGSGARIGSMRGWW